MTSQNQSRELLERITGAVQAGKANADTDIPPGSKGQAGVVELVAEAIEAGVGPQEILEAGLMAGMQVIGRRFAANEIYVPEVLIAARAMKAGVARLGPLLAGEARRKRGVFIIGTVAGDLHDIGKNLVGIVVEGAGWQVVDLGVDCPAEKFLEALQTHDEPHVVGLSALLTTTMINMGEIIARLREAYPELIVLIGGAPVSQSYADEIGASGYASNPSEAVELLDRLVPAGESGKARK